ARPSFALGRASHLAIRGPARPAAPPGRIGRSTFSNSRPPGAVPNGRPPGRYEAEPAPGQPRPGSRRPNRRQDGEGRGAETMRLRLFKGTAAGLARLFAEAFTDETGWQTAAGRDTDPSRPVDSLSRPPSACY